MKMQIIQIPRMIPKDAPINSSGIKYINMEEKIREYIEHYNPIDMCFIFKERFSNDVNDPDFLVNDVKDIVGKVVSITDNFANVQILNDEYFKSYEGKIFLSVASLCDKVDAGYMVKKVVRFEARIIV